MRISVRITPNFELGLPMINTSLLTNLQQNPTSSLWEILLTKKNKQTKKWHSESIDPAKALRPSDMLDRKPVVELWPVPKLRLAALWQSFGSTFSKKSVFKTGIKFWPHRGLNSRPSRFQHKNLTDLAIAPYASDYYYSPYSPKFIKIRPVFHEKQLSGSKIRISIRITPNFELGLPVIITSLLTKFHPNPTSSLWEILLTNKQTNKKWHSEGSDPAKARGPCDILDRNPFVELWPIPKLSISSLMTEFLAVLSQKKCFQNWDKVLATQRFALSTLRFSVQCSNRLNYSAYSSDYYYSRFSPNFIKIRRVVHEKHLSGSQMRISIRIAPNFELGLPMIITPLLTKIHQNPTSSL